MSNDVGTDEDSGARDSDAVRDDIMKRLLDYQRKQRTPEPASSVWATPPVRAPEAQAEPAVEEQAPAEPQMGSEPEAPPEAERPAEQATVEPSHDERPAPVQEAPREDVGLAAAQPSLETRGSVESLRAALEGVRSQIEDLRQTFQDMAIAADERLAEIEEQIARARGSNEPS